MSSMQMQQRGKRSVGGCTGIAFESGTTRLPVCYRPLRVPLLASASTSIPHTSSSRQKLVVRAVVDANLEETAKVTTKVNRNANFGKLQAGYLFPEIARMRREHCAKFPDARVISLGIGDTTEPVPKPITDAMSSFATGLNTLEGYSGYGAEQGNTALRETIASCYYPYKHISAEDVFISDGSKCDISRLQMIFSPDVRIAVQDPSYPAYVDSSVISGKTGMYDDTKQQYRNIVYMPCKPENDFFPDLEALNSLSEDEKPEVIFFCSPNNPTGAAAKRHQVEQLIKYAHDNGSIIIYDTAYAPYISDPECPKSIYELDGSSEVAIETCSFSKFAGFTGVRLGWTVVPSTLLFADGTPVRQDFNRVMTTCFNGASNVAQAGAMACVSEQGQTEMMNLVSYYMENATILRETFEALGFSVYGGKDAPYVWVGFPGRASWDVFGEILEKTHIVTTPGSGFGPAGEGFVRVSAFGHREDVLEATARLKQMLS